MRIVIITLICVTAWAVPPDVEMGEATIPNAPSNFLLPFSVTFVVKHPANNDGGNFTVLVQPAWAPRGAKRFAQLVDTGFYDGSRFFRVVKGYLAQFGISGNPDVEHDWRSSMLLDDRMIKTNTKGRVSFASNGPNHRTTQVFINLKNNSDLDSKGLVPFAEVVDGMDVVSRLYSGYGDIPPVGQGPLPSRIELEGNAYLLENYPELSYIEVAVFSNRSEADAIVASGELALSGEKAMKRARPLLLIGAFSFGMCVVFLFARVCAKYWQVEYEGVDATGESPTIQGSPTPGGATHEGTLGPGKRKKWIWKPSKAPSRRGQRKNSFGMRNVVYGKRVTVPEASPVE